MLNIVFHQSIDGQKLLFTDESVAFLEKLLAEFAPRVTQSLQARVTRMQSYRQGNTPDFDEATADIRQGDWRVAPIPEDLQDRRVELTAPPSDPKMVINALNANVKCFMADFEDSLAPTWENVVAGQLNLQRAILGTLTYEDKARGKSYQLNDKTALLLCRVRGLHLQEAHISFNGQAIPGALLDFALYFFHNYQALLAKGTGVYYYIPKLEHYQEAQLWADIFAFTENMFDLPKSTIRATILIETFPAVFQMNEILYALKDYAVALNCGRWDYIFSYIKTLSHDKDYVLSDRDQLGMTAPFLSAYSRLLIQTCHRRGALAMGGMAAVIPSSDAETNRLALIKVTADKQLEANNGHDGTWIAHPALADTALAVFDKAIGNGNGNQMHVTRADDVITKQDLYTPPPLNCTEDGVRHNMKIALQYIEAWLRGNGCTALNDLMEDAATAEIARASVWQLLHHQTPLDDGTILNAQGIDTLIVQLLGIIRQEIGEAEFQAGKFTDASKIVKDLVTQEEFITFLTLPCYENIVAK